MKIRRIINLVQITIGVILLILVLLDVLGLFTSLIIMITIQFILGNIIMPIVYKSHAEKFNIFLKPYTSSYSGKTKVDKTMNENKITFNSRLYNRFILLLVILLCVYLILYIILFFLNHSRSLESYTIIIGIFSFAPIFLLFIYKFLRFPLSIDINEITGYYKPTLDLTMNVKKDKIDFSTINSVTFIENRLMDPLGTISIVEFTLDDGTKRYLNLIMYSNKTRGKILDMMRRFLILEDKET